MRKKAQNYPETEKFRLLREYYESGMSKRQFARTHGLCNESLLIAWLKRYGSVLESLSLPGEPLDEETMSNQSKEDYHQEIAGQKKKIKELEQALFFSRLETKARDMLIDKAEEYFDIQIRKKFGAK